MNTIITSMALLEILSVRYVPEPRSTRMFIIHVGRISFGAAPKREAMSNEAWRGPVAFTGRSRALISISALFVFCAACGRDTSEPSMADMSPPSRSDMPVASRVDMAAADMESGGLDMSAPVTGEDMRPDMPGDCVDCVAPASGQTVAATPFDIVQHIAREQPGLVMGSLDAARVSYARGRVLDPVGEPIQGARVAAQGQDELGWAVTDARGDYELVYHGGGRVVFEVSAEGFLPIQQHDRVEWGSFWDREDAILTPLDASVTSVASGAQTATVHVGPMVVDERGERQASLLFKPGTRGTMRMADGTTRELPMMNVRVTEYTVGERGPQAMPGPLTPGVLYTWAAELSVDEAMEAGAVSVEFDEPVLLHLDNFLDLPVGAIIPVGTYDRARGFWVPDPDGVNFGVVSHDGELADVDVDGDGSADPQHYAELGIDDDERRAIAARFAPGESFWRIHREHFSPVDANLAMDYSGILSGMRGRLSNKWGRDRRGPRNGWERREQRLQEACAKSGSIITCQNRTLGEVIGVAGAGNLYYDSSRVWGRGSNRAFEFTMIDDAVLPLVSRVVVQVNIAGQHHEFEYTSSELEEDPVFAFEWDGNDGFGRQLQGTQRGVVRVSYDFPRTVVTRMMSCSGSCGSGSPENAIGQSTSFGQTPGQQGSGLYVETGTRVVTESIGLDVVLGGLDAQVAGLGGWTFGPHHTFDPAIKSMIKSDGTVLTGSNAERVDFGVDAEVEDFTMLSNGSIAWLESDTITVEDVDGVRQVIPVASGAEAVFTDMNDVLYTRHYYTGCEEVGHCGRIIKHGEDGAEIPILGNGHICYTPGGCGEGELGAQAPMGELLAHAFAPDGSLYFIELPARDDFEGRRAVLRQLLANGRLKTLSSVGDVAISDGALVHDVALPVVPHSVKASLAVSADGLVYFTLNMTRHIDDLTASGPTDVVWRLDGDGVVHRFLGGSEPFDPQGEQRSADVRVGEIEAIDVLPDGRIVVAQGHGYGKLRGLLVVDEEHIDVLFGDFYQSSTSRCSQGYGSHIQVVVTPDSGVLCLSTEEIPDTTSFLKVSSRAQDTLYKVEDLAEREVYEFDGQGRHLRTTELSTGEELYSFEYDGAGLLTGIQGAAGRVGFERDELGQVQAILGVDGARTQVSMERGWLSQLEGPEGRKHAFTYGDGGLLVGMTDPAGRETTFTYDDGGALLTDRAPDGGVQTLTYEAGDDDSSYAVELETGARRVYRYEVAGVDGGMRTRNIEPGGAVTTLTQRVGSSELVTPDGVSIEEYSTTHPVFSGRRFTTDKRMRTPAGLERTVSKFFSVEYDEEQLDQAFPKNVKRTSTFATVNGSRYWSIERTYGPGPATETVTSPAGRARVTSYDDRGRLSMIARSGLAGRTFSYTEQDRLERVEQLDQFTRFTYDLAGNVVEREDALGRRNTFTYDSAGVMTSWTTPNTHTYTYEHDASGELTRVITPGSHEYTFTYDEAGRRDSVGVPSIGVFRWGYDLDGYETSFTRPSGDALQTLYDEHGRHAGWSARGADTTITYVEPSERLHTMTRTRPDGGSHTLAFEYDGHLITSITSSGDVGATFGYRYEQDMTLGDLTVTMGGESRSWGVTRDDDGILQTIGDLALGYEGMSRVPHTYTIGDFTRTDVLDELGRATSSVFAVGGTPVFEQSFEYNASGLMERSEETVSGSSEAKEYGHDAFGQLVSVVRDPDGAADRIEEYTYDGDANRTRSHRGAATYDAYKLTALDGQSVTTDADGFITSIDGMTLTYGGHGELTSASGAFGTITYTYDGLGRRATRTKGAQTWSFAYGNLSRPNQVTGITRPDGTQVWFDYTPAGRLMRVTAGGQERWIVADPLGSPRAIVDATGSITRRIDYDAFGAITADSDPSAHIEIGYAGGIHDPDTGLVNFWHREYHPRAGRWTSLDPAFFSGDKRNLYVYAQNSPVTHKDPYGLWCVGASIYAGIGGGAKICHADGKTSVCGEVGLGKGGSLELSPGAGTDSTGVNVLVAVSGSVSVAGVGVGIGGEAKLTNCGIAQAKLQLATGPVTNEKTWSSEGKPSTDVKLTKGLGGKEDAPDGGSKTKTKSKLKAKLSAEAKVAAEFCEEL